MMAIGISQKGFDYSGKTVIDCPSCGTRFCVKNDIIRKHAEPNFHCSRCDNVFRVSPAALRVEAANDSKEAVSAQRNNTTSSAASRFFDISKEPNLSSGVSAPHESTRHESTRHESSRHESSHQDNQLNSYQQDSYQTSAQAKLSSSGTIGGEGSREVRPRRQMKAIELLKNVNIFTKKDKSKEPTDSSSKQDQRMRSTEQMAQVNSQHSDRQSGQLTSGRWQDLLSIATPILIFLLTLSLVTFYFVKNPDSASSVISAIVPAASRMAPAGLHIMETEFTKIILDSGEEVALISGEIQNKTNQKFGAVQLEAQAFDREGAIVKKSLTSSATALVNTRVKSLSPKMIESLQDAKGPKRFVLEPNQTEKFTVALLGDDINHAAYFSIRIYSVRAQG